MNAFGFHHQFVPGASERTLLLLHGTGGNENDLLPLGRALDERAALLSPRGKVTENGANRFFRRLAEGVFDEADVIWRAHELGKFLEVASQEYQLDREGIIAVGYSNGANIATAMMLLGLGEFSGAILFRPMAPLSKPPQSRLGGERILLCGGHFDPIATPATVQALAELLRERGAEVEVRLQESGHELSAADLEIARDWLAGAAIA